MTKKKPCKHCTATRNTHRYDDGKIYSTRTTHQPHCPTLLNKRPVHSQAPTRGAHEADGGVA